MSRRIAVEHRRYAAGMVDSRTPRVESSKLATTDAGTSVGERGQ